MMKIRKKLLHKCIKIFMYIVNQLWGENEKKIIFSSFGGKSYSDNPRAISEELYKQDKSFEITWLISAPEDKGKKTPSYVKCIKNLTLRAFFELATAKFWVDNVGKPTYLKKSDSQIYIQTWHGDRGFKKILFDSPFATKEFELFESTNCDLAIAGSEYGEKKYRSAFRYQGKILKKGCPRNDILINSNYSDIERIKEKLDIRKDQKIILFAPSYRRMNANKFQSIDYIDIPKLLSVLEEITSKEWLSLIRCHSSVKGFSNSSVINNQIIDVSYYEDMRDLLLISDLLITDYSSSAGDFPLLRKPVILYQHDQEEYIKNDRSFYFDIEESPFIVAKNQNELLYTIRNLDWDGISKNCQNILDFYGAQETGIASKLIVDYILQRKLIDD